jgi:molybdate transport system substrate-binding protein
MIRDDRASTLLRFLLSAALLFLITPHRAPAQPRLRIAAAADLQSAMDELAKQFEQQTHMKLDLTYGSSGNFFSQILNGAPFDLFFSADLQYPQKLAEAKLVEPATLYKYALGQIVLWAPADANIEVAKLHWNSLLDRSVQKIAIANPQHAPYGRAAISALQKAGIYDKVRDKLVFGENVSQAAQFVQSGNAQVGIIARSLVLSPAMRTGKYWDVPAGTFPLIEQAAVVLKNSVNKQEARAFLEFVRSAAGRAILAKYGFASPGSHPSGPESEREQH